MSPKLSSPEDVTLLLVNNPAVRLLRKDSAPLIIAFLWAAFRERRQASYGGRDLTTLLSDFLFSANEVEVRYPRPARDYLESWTADGFLRQFYEDRAEEATFELTPAGEQALQWIAELDRREFVGAESRLLQVFDQLRELAEGTTQDQERRGEQLLARRAEIDRQLQALAEGELDRLDDTRIRERFFLAEETATKLLADFRQIEDNFRRLNAAAREELIVQSTDRGTVLAEIFNGREAILDTDQGRTFAAFWVFLMDQNRRDDLRRFLDQIFAQPELAAYRRGSFLHRMEHDLTDAGTRVIRTTDRLVEQLRRFLQSRAFLENQRTAQLITDIEQLAIAVKKDPPTQRRFATVEGKAKVNLTMDRGPFVPPDRLELPDGPPAAGRADTVVTDALFDQLYVDPAVLKGRLEVLLRDRDQITLGEVVAAMPPERGLSELIAYFGIATDWEKERRAAIHPDRRQSIPYDKDGLRRYVDFPETIFLA